MCSFNFNQRCLAGDRNLRGHAARVQLNVIDQTLAYAQQDLLVNYLAKSLRLYLDLVGSWRKGRNLIGTFSAGLGGPACSPPAQLFRVSSSPIPRVGSGRLFGLAFVQWPAPVAGDNVKFVWWMEGSGPLQVSITGTTAGTLRLTLEDTDYTRGTNPLLATTTVMAVISAETLGTGARGGSGVVDKTGGA